MLGIEEETFVATVNHQGVVRYFPMIYSGVLQSQVKVGVFSGTGIYVSLVKAVDFLQIGTVNGEVSSEKSVRFHAEGASKDKGESNGASQLEKHFSESILECGGYNPAAGLREIILGKLRPRFHQLIE